MKNIVVFASGNGSNFKNIYFCIKNKEINGKLVMLISNNPNCGAINFAKKYKINFKILNKYRCNYPLAKEYEIVLKKCNVDLILLAGFMKKIPKNIVVSYKNKIINIHPALLPKYGGKGFYGMHVHNAVIKSRDQYSGATVHYVNEFYDEGDIIIQKKVRIDLTDDPKSLAEKVLMVEHEIYPSVVKAFCDDKKLIRNNIE